MSGHVSVASKLGQGSVFSFEIPLELAHSVDSAEPAASLFAGRRVLIVDDNEVNRRMLSLLISRWELTWIEVPGPKEALDILQQGERFDAALLDFQMPVIDGISLARQIRQIPNCSQLPLILVSSQTGD